MRRRFGYRPGPFAILSTLAVAGSLLFPTASPAQAPHNAPDCDEDNGAITLPEGFCATSFADQVGPARHIAAAPNGDLFVALRNTRGVPGGILILRDTTGDGRADLQIRFGENGGSGIAWRDDYLYFATDDAVLRYHLPLGHLEPGGAPDTLVMGLPANGGHSAKTIALGKGDDLFVNIGSLTNSCQVADRRKESLGQEPCIELENRAGIWRFSASRLRQTQADGERYATGLRNVVALTAHPDNATIYGAQHGRDQLFANWPGLYNERKSAELPSEEFVRIERGADFGWPYCYHDWQQGKKVLAPEYGGDGQRIGRCDKVANPIVAFPGHWAPNAVTFYSGTQFPPSYHGGAFIAFHGSWNRAPMPQEGYNVVFVPFARGEPAGEYTIFADGFRGRPNTAPGADHRPGGLAVGPDGALYIADDAGGRIWRVVYHPGR